MKGKNCVCWRGLDRNLGKGITALTTAQDCFNASLYLRGHVFGRLYSDGGVPLPRR